MAPLPTRGAVCSSETRSPASPRRPGCRAARSAALRPCYRSALLGVVLLALEAAALLVLVFLDAPLLLRAHLAVGARASLHRAVVRLAALEARRFAVGELARAHALLDAPLLVHVALHVGLHALRRGRIGIAGLRIVLLAVDVAAHLVLLARKAGFFRRRQFSVLERPRLVALDFRFLALKARRFARVELSGLQALLDALLLVHVAPGQINGYPPAQSPFLSPRFSTGGRPPASRRRRSRRRSATSWRGRGTPPSSWPRPRGSMPRGARSSSTTAQSFPTTTSSSP